MLRTFILAIARRLLLAAAIAGAGASHAGVLTAAYLQAHFPAPYVVGEKATDIPVWPIFRQNGPETELAGYVFESIDLAPIPGFSGTPLNLLIAMNPDGGFFDVRVLSHHEPVFLDGLGEAPLFAFVAQYKGLSLKQNIKIGVRGAAAAQSTNVYIDGVAKATASVRIINQSMLAAALKVARAKLHYSGSRDPDQVAQVRADRFAAMDWPALLDSGLVGHLRLTQGDVAAAFAGTRAAHAPPETPGGPSALFIDLYAVFVEIPSAGRNLFDEHGLAALHARSHADDHLLLLLSNGPYGFLGEDAVRGAVPDRLALRQDKLPIELRDMDVDVTPRGTPPFAMSKVFRIIGAAGLDLGQPIGLDLRVTRSVGVVYPERVSRDFTLALQVPQRYVIASTENQKGWWPVWRSRAPELAVLLAGLGLLGAVLLQASRPAPAGRGYALAAWVRRGRALRIFRPLYLLFTLVFIGWYAQAQLSIVNLVALLDATRAARSWAFFLYDPLSTVLWLFVLASLVVWGRGTFCGWLCPYGALQELAALGGRLARVPALRLRDAWDGRLKRLKYVLLAAILVASLVSAAAADRLVEIEPFKTAITLLFVRSWPFAAYAIAMVAVGVFVNKFFCRYLCPLGAALALAGRLRRWDWIARRPECGTPCQTCRYRCDYQAIDPAGRVQYDECFQCMECVAIHDSVTQCAPLILQAKGRKAITITAIARPGAPR